MNFVFPYIGNVIIPTDELIFFRGVGQPPTSQVFRMMNISMRVRHLFGCPVATLIGDPGDPMRSLSGEGSRRGSDQAIHIPY